MASTSGQKSWKIIRYFTTGFGSNILTRLPQLVISVGWNSARNNHVTRKKRLGEVIRVGLGRIVLEYCDHIVTCRKSMGWPKLRLVLFRISVEVPAYRLLLQEEGEISFEFPQWLKASKSGLLQSNNQRKSLKVLGWVSIWGLLGTGIACLQNGNAKNIQFHALCPITEKSSLTFRRGIHFDQLHIW